MKKTVCFILAVVLMFSFASCDEEKSTNSVATVNGEAVTQAEVDYFKTKLKAQLLNDYLEEYSVEYTEDFWQTEFDGKTPEEALYEKALEESVVAKIQFLLMKEEGIYEDITYEGLYETAENFNKENENKEGVVGIKTIQMSQFYTYYLQNGVMELQNIYAENKLKPTEKEIEEKIKELRGELESSSKEDFESIAKSKLKTEKYEKYIAELREKAKIEEVE